MEQNLNDDARALVEEALALWDPGRRILGGPDSGYVEARLCAFFGNAAQTAAAAGGPERWSATADAVLGRVEPLHYSDALHQISLSRLRLADDIRAGGDEARARKLVAANLRMLDGCPPSSAPAPLLAVERAISLLASGDRAASDEALRRVDLAGLTLDYPLAQSLAELTALSAGWGVGGGSYPSSIPAGATAEAWAERVLADLRARFEGLGLDPEGIPNVTLKMAPFAMLQLTPLRKAGKLEEAGRLADRLHALADRLVTAFPRRAECHLLRSEAFAQKFKNAFRADRDDEVRFWLRRSLQAALDAVAIDPENAEALDALTVRQRKLALFTSRP
ncbi:MAG: hypothetical protein U0835_20850 [Isosphaeraceae bacterium]